MKTSSIALSAVTFAAALAIGAVHAQGTSPGTTGSTTGATGAPSTTGTTNGTAGGTNNMGPTGGGAPATQRSATPPPSTSQMNRDTTGSTSGTTAGTTTGSSSGNANDASMGSRPARADRN
jgi:hypothetical protein